MTPWTTSSLRTLIVLVHRRSPSFMNGTDAAFTSLTIIALIASHHRSLALTISTCIHHYHLDRHKHQHHHQWRQGIVRETVLCESWRTRAGGASSLNVSGRRPTSSPHSTPSADGTTRSQERYDKELDKQATSITFENGIRWIQRRTYLEGTPATNNGYDHQWL